MEQTLTLVVKLNATPEQSSQLEETAQIFTDACAWINENVNHRLTNRNSIQVVCYQDIKEQFGLKANDIVRACARVGANRLAAKAKGKKVKGFKPRSFDCDGRTLSFRDKDWTISVASKGKRLRLSLRASNYQRGKLFAYKPTSAQICQHRDGQWYAHIQLKDTAPQPKKTSNVIGVDFGRREIPRTTTDKGWDGKDIQQKRDKFSRVRASLQKRASQGTRSTRRRCRETLKKLSGRENRYQQWLNHNISKSIIEEAKARNSTVAIEDLRGIRDRSNEKPGNKTHRRRSNSWAFYQLRLFLEYKGIKEGVKVIVIPPAYTSQTCHCCNHIGVRTNKNFKCSNQECSWIGDADLNGALMIQKWVAL
uniref:RNA-guided endonuclease InsQ/TnpB family protein n=1 Tax=Okeania sp. SIO2F4 TaxID=2607790 RepID=UPI0025DAB99A|nr:transposase [Okeania sp. SIO2F4]